MLEADLARLFALLKRLDSVPEPIKVFLSDISHHHLYLVISNQRPGLSRFGGDVGMACFQIE